MDAIIIGCLSIVLTCVFWPTAQESEPIQQMETVVQNPRLNPEMIHDEHAFMKIANELGFH